MTKGMTNQLRPVDRHTRAPKRGRVIRCRNCDEDLVVHHFSWSSIKCRYCDDFTDKRDWLVVPERPRDLKAAGLLLAESWGVDVFKPADLRLVGNWLFVRESNIRSWVAADAISATVYSVVRWDIFGDIWCEPFDEVPVDANPFIRGTERPAINAFCDRLDAFYAKHFNDSE